MTPRFAASAPSPAQPVLWHALTSEDVFEGLSSEAEVRALQSLSAPSCRVLPGRDVVPGDVVLLESGGRVPADLRTWRSAVRSSGAAGAGVW